MQNAQRFENNPVSTLSQLLREEYEKSLLGATLQLTVFLPDRSSIEMTVKDSIDVQGLLLQILAYHKEQELRPPLRYDQPKLYELRMHEGFKMKLLPCRHYLNKIV